MTTPTKMNYDLYLQLPKPSKKPLRGTLSSDKNVAHFFAGLLLQAELSEPAIVFINPDGIMLRGYEPDGFDQTGRAKFRYQEWLCRYAPDG